MGTEYYEINDIDEINRNEKMESRKSEHDVQVQITKDQLEAK